MNRNNYISLLAVMACCWSTSGSAANWAFDPRVEVGGETDDNFRLLPSDGKSSVSGGFGDLRLDMHTVDPVNELRFVPGVHATFYPNSRDDQSTDPYASFDVSHRGQKSVVGLDANYLKQSVVNSDRVTSDPGGGLGNPGSGDSGYIALRNRRELFSVTPNGTYNLTQRDQLALMVNYTDVNYEKFIPATNVGYVHIGTELGWIHALTERHSVTLRGVFSRNDPDKVPQAVNSGTTTNSYGLQGEWTMSVSDLSRAYARLGVQRSKFDRVSAGGSDSKTTYVAGAGVSWSFQVTQIFIDLTRTVDPSSTGFSVQRNQARLRFARTFTPLLTGFVSARIIADRAVESNATFRDRDYATASVGLERRIGREWAVKGEYDYTRQKFSGDFGPGKSNAFLLSVVYEPHRETDSVGRYRH